MDENYGALLISIFRKCIPEQAFAYVRGEPAPKIATFGQEIKELREMGLTWPEVGRIYNADPGTVFKAAKRAI